MGLPLLKVIQEVSTRWNSSIHSQTLVQIRALLSAIIMTFLNRVKDSLTALQWELINKCLSIVVSCIIFKRKHY